MLKKRKLGLLLFFPFLILMGLEVIQRPGIEPTFKWIINYPVMLIVNYTIVLAIAAFFSSIFASWRLGNMVTALMLWGLSLVSSYKQYFLGEPLFPWDVTLYRYAIELLPLLTSQTGLWTILIIGLFCFLLFWLLRPLRNLTLGYRLRLGLAIPTMLFLGSILAFNSSPAKDILAKANIENIYWVQSENYKQNGFALSFMMNFQSAVVLPPEGYSLEAVKSITLPLTAETNIANGEENSTKPQIKPNVIFVMSEAFWDPTEIKSLTFSEDPLPAIRDLQKNYPDTKLLSPVFGGGTANTEFEVLTGLSTAFLPQGSIPYQQYVRSNLPALPRIFKSNGYETIAIHPYYKWFYRRDEVYPLLGFDRFEGLEDFQEPALKGPFVSDMEVTEKISRAVKETEAPVFLYAVSIQNHGPYEANRYETSEVKIDGELSSNSTDMIETYTQGVRDADSAFGALIQQLEQQAEPTIVVFFGDHLPLLGKDYLLYKESKFISGSQNNWTLAERMKMREVPLVMWSNFSLKQGELGEVMSPALVGPIIMENSAIPLSGHYTLLQEISKVLPGLSAGLFVDSQGEPSETIPPEALSLIHHYRILQYNLLFEN